MLSSLCYWGEWLSAMNIYCHLFMVSWIFFLIRLRQRTAHNEVHSLSLCSNSCISRPADPFSSSLQTWIFFLVNLGTAMSLTQWEFELQAASLLSDQARLAYIISHLTKRAEAWAPTKYCLRSSICILFWQFTTSSRSTHGLDRQLWLLLQGRGKYLTLL